MSTPHHGFFVAFDVHLDEIDVLKAYAGAPEDRGAGIARDRNRRYALLRRTARGSQSALDDMSDDEIVGICLEADGAGVRRERARVRPVAAGSTIAGIVSGEFDRIPEANDAFLKLVGYSREDLVAGRLHWPELTPPEYSALDDLAHEEGLRFGACTPYEKELLRKDGARVPVLVATAVLKLSPFRWITFVQDLRERDHFENVGDEDVEGKQNFEEMVGNSAA